MHHPQISVIMPAFNTIRWLGQAVESVRLQTGVSWELLIIDDGSTDGTRELAEQYAASDKRVRVLKNEGGKGAGGARNTGMRAARAERYMFLDSDDVFLPGALEALYTVLEASGMPVARGLGSKFCMQRGLFVPAEHAESATANQEFSYPVHSFLLHIYRADFLHKHGIQFPEDLPIAEDIAFLCQVYPLLPEIPAISRSVHLYRINHKKIHPSAAKAMALATHMLRARASFARHHRQEWTPPYIERMFLPQWLPCLHAVQAKSRESALEFLALCRELMTGWKEALRPTLQRQLGANATAFLDRCGAGDTAGMLAVLQASGRITPASVFMGIDRAPRGLAWQAYRLLSLARNCVLSPPAWSILWYLGQLRWRAFLRRSSLGSATPAPANTQGN